MAFIGEPWPTKIAGMRRLVLLVFSVVFIISPHKKVVVLIVLVVSLTLHSGYALVEFVLLS